MQILRPVLAEDAVAFARAEFEKRTEFWPRLLVAFSEQTLQGEALRFALNIYEQLAERRGNYFVQKLIHELSQEIRQFATMESATVRATSLRIWEDDCDRSMLKRGVTRLFNAFGHQLDGNFDDCEVEVTRALGLGILNDNEVPIVSDFDLVISNFIRAYY